MIRITHINIQDSLQAQLRMLVRSSIEAVVDPSITDYFYFLADKEGKNHFAEDI